MHIPRNGVVVGPRILVKVKTSELKAKTKGGLLHIPDDVLKADQRAVVEGEVLAMGAQCYNLPSQALPTGQKEPWCKVGDTVVFNQYAGSRVLVDGFDDHVLLNDEDVQMVLDVKAEGVSND